MDCCFPRTTARVPNDYALDVKFVSVFNEVDALDLLLKHVSTGV
jgi:hypothetical protein